MNKPRLILLPGFGEDSFIFNKLIPYFHEYDLVLVNYRESLNQHTLSKIDVQAFAHSIITNYSITPKDKLIGHSMGGYFAFVIREFVSCDICMLASFSDPSKVRRITNNQFVTILTAKTGLIKTSFVQKTFLKPAIGKYYESVYRSVLQNMKTFSSNQLAKMVKMSFGEALHSKLKNPLRIHAKNDTIVRPPKENYYEVKLGHFCLMLEPEEVIKGMQQWLEIIKFEQ